MKGYVVGYKSREEAQHKIIDYWFSTSPNEAIKLSWREGAEAEILHFSRGVTINEDLKRPYLLTDFQIEEFEDDFVICANGPFELRGHGQAAV